MNIFAIAALCAMGYLGARATIHGVKKAEHKIVSVFHHHAKGAAKK